MTLQVSLCILSKIVLPCILSGSCPVASFGASTVKPPGSATTVLISYSPYRKMLQIKVEDSIDIHHLCRVPFYSALSGLL
jgi:hypothetical protein